MKHLFLFLFGFAVGAGLVAHLAPVQAPAPIVQPASKDPTAFAGNLSAAIKANPQHGLLAREVTKILDGPDSPRRTRILQRLEHHAAAHLEKPVGQIDWAAVPWAVILEALLRVLVLLLPLL